MSTHELRQELSTDNRTIINRYFAAVNTEQWDQLASLITEDANYKAVGARPRTGRSDVVRYFESLFRAWRIHFDEPQTIIAQGNVGAATVRFRGESAAGISIEFDAVDWFEFRDGKLASWSTWYDLQSVRAALGVTHDA